MSHSFVHTIRQEGARSKQGHAHDAKLQPRPPSRWKSLKWWWYPPGGEGTKSAWESSRSIGLTGESDKEQAVMGSAGIRQIALPTVAGGRAADESQQGATSKDPTARARCSPVLPADLAGGLNPQAAWITPRRGGGHGSSGRGHQEGPQAELLARDFGEEGIDAQPSATACGASPG